MRPPNKRAIIALSGLLIVIAGGLFVYAESVNNGTPYLAATPTPVVPAVYPIDKPPGATVITGYNSSPNIPVPRDPTCLPPIPGVTEPENWTNNGYIPPYAGGIYFPMDNGTSKIYLINSTASYGVYSQDMSLQPGGNAEAHAGDPCVIINGTIRNDYNTSYWIDLSAQLYDANGKPVGRVLTDVPTHYAGQVYAESGSTVNFSFTVDYDKKDVSRYELSASLAPGPLP